MSCASGTLPGANRKLKKHNDFNAPASGECSAPLTELHDAIDWGDD